MTYEEAREFISQSNQYGIVPGLETITELLNRLANPQEQLRIVHVAGTNGKGSTCAFLTSILNQAGYSVGRYISPSVFSYRERIQISRPDISNHRQEAKTKPVVEYITREGVCRTVELIKPICESMVREGFSHPTSFEIETAMTFLYFLWEKVDFVVLEVGLGGRLDATNVISKPVCSVIASISMDHMQFLGDTLQKIASEKAGIIKAGCPVVTCDQEPEVISVFRNRAEEMGSELYIADSRKAKDLRFSLEGTEFRYEAMVPVIREKDMVTNYRIQLLGRHQVKNAILALEAARVLQRSGYHIDEEAIKTGLSTAHWSGRLELLSTRPYLLIDGAHNEDAARTLRESIEIYFTNRRIIFMIGVLADKDYQKILEITAPLADTIYTLTPENPRALRSDNLAEEAGKYCDRVFDAGNVTQALQLAYEEAGEEDVILAFGSLSFLGDLVHALKLRKDEDK